MSKKNKKKSAYSGHKNQPIGQEEGAVRAKKHLGQHFLKDENIAKKIADTLSLEGYNNVLEIGPGMGVLTKYLLQRDLARFCTHLKTMNRPSA